MAIEIVTNGHERPVLYGFQLSESEKADFDYLGPEEIDDHEFFRYRGHVYDLDEFQRINEALFPAFKGWDGNICDTFFSGVLIRYPRDERGEVDTTEYVICGTFYS